MHALKLYGPHAVRQNLYGAARGLHGPREWMYNFCSNRECDVTEALDITTVKQSTTEPWAYFSVCAVYTTWVNNTDKVLVLVFLQTYYQIKYNIAHCE